MGIRSVLLLAILFWGTGGLVCLCLSLRALYIESLQPAFQAENQRSPWARWASFDCGMAVGALQAAAVLVPFARREAVRIVSLHNPRPIHFFPPHFFFTVLCVAVTCAVVERLTSQYYLSVIIFIGLLAAIGTALMCGAFRLCIVLCAPPAPTEALRATLLLAAGATLDEVAANTRNDAQTAGNDAAASALESGQSCDDLAHGAVSPLAAAAESELRSESETRSS
mmetsp:Transcript_5573/g.17144  ORF Transcript_5573/g.17144 Transcript_5573/m.17144 type:complete len:225 (+) Transcript_5573:2692-3366(+)